jgi:purine-nucleoside phosphorylase
MNSEPETPPALHAPIAATASFLRARLPGPPEIVLVLGSGLGGFADRVEAALELPYAAIPGFIPSTVAGHSGRLVVGTLAGVSCAVLAGRIHYYEGHDPAAVVFPLRCLLALGTRTVILTNAAGGIGPGCDPGALMLIRDHINLTGAQPLRGPNDARLGPRFPDMTTAYDPGLRELARRAAAELGMPLAEGVYAGVTGPAYETPAEVRMLATLGADAVGMSTVLETIAAVHMGARVLGLSCIANRGAGLHDRPLTHEEVTQAARAAEGRFTALLAAIFAKLGAQNAGGTGRPDKRDPEN